MGDIVGQGQFDADDPDARLKALGRDRRAAEQPAAADRAEDDIEAGDILQQLEGGCALTGHHAVVVERMNQHCAGPRRDFGASGLAGTEAGFAEGDTAAETLDIPQNLGLGRTLRHHDVRRDAAQPGGAGKGGGMVAGGVRHDAMGGLGLGEREDRVARSARLEGAGGLEILAF